MIEIIERHNLSIFRKEKWKGDDRAKWTVRKEDSNGNTLSQVRHEDLTYAIADCVASIDESKGKER